MLALQITASLAEERGMKKGTIKLDVPGGNGQDKDLKNLANIPDILMKEFKNRPTLEDYIKSLKHMAPSHEKPSDKKPSDKKPYGPVKEALFELAKRAAVESDWEDQSLKEFAPILCQEFKARSKDPKYKNKKVLKELKTIKDIFCE